MARPNNVQKYLSLLQDYYARHRVLPSYSGISSLLGFSAKNAAAALVACERAPSFAEGLSMARESLSSGAAHQRLEAMIAAISRTR